MNKKAVVLLSGGLDSTLTIRILQEQGIEVEGLNFRTAFSCCKDEALETARQFGVKVTVVSTDDDYFKVVEKPKYGWGKGINPCVDCRVYMFRLARKFMDDCGASFVASGEVIGQRPMSQLKYQLAIIEKESNLEGLLLRPLSAKLLEPTLPEIEGIVDRERLYAVSGRSRKELLELCKKYGIDNPPQPSTGCTLTEPEFAKKVRDVFQHNPDYERWDFELVKTGRHFRLDEKTKVVIGRNETENQMLERLQRAETVLYIPFNFMGPSAMLVGEYAAEKERQALSMILRYTRDSTPETLSFETYRAAGEREILEFSGAAMKTEEMDLLKI